MAPNLRSSSHAWSNNSRPSTPLGAASTASSFTESTRPRKQRRTGRHSRVATDPLQDPPSRTQSRLEQSGNGISDTHSESHVDGNSADWMEPPLRVPVPSYDDTPWSAVSHSGNPILSTMRPLGAMPTSSDLRKVGLVPVKPSVQNIPAKRNLQAASNGEKTKNKPRTPVTPAEEPIPEPITTKVKPLEDMSHFTSLPVPTSTDVDVDRIKDAVEKAVRLALETNNIPVSRGLLRLWETCHKDPFALSILDGICQENPGPRERSVFQSVMRSAWKEVQAEAGDDLTPAPVVARPRSASSLSSLSSAKSLDVETFAPGMTPGATTARHRGKGKQAKGGTRMNVRDLLNPEPTTAAAGVPPPPSAATEESPQKRALEDEPTPEETARVKRTRLQKTLPTIVASESRLRSSLASQSASNAPSPVPTATSQSQPASVGAPVPTSRERSESPASSDAGDNRRLTPTLSSDNDRVENNDFCHNCNRSGQLLCCDGCPNSFHFSCLNPPLDPASPPEGDWFCPKCSLSRPMSAIIDALDNAPQKDFALPARFRDYFAGVRTGDGGKYEEIVTLPKINRAGRGNRSGRYDDPYLSRTSDSKGNLIICTACGHTSNGNRPIIQCDFCPCAFHMDCMDPPLAMPPTQKTGSDRRHHNWMCPNHVWHDLAYTVQDEEGYDMIKRIRRPKAPRMVDIEVLLDEEDGQEMEEQEEEGVVYRVSEHGVKLDFIRRVKRENEEYQLMKNAADTWYDYATSEFDKLISKAQTFYASATPPTTTTAVEDSTTDIINSRTAAEREAAANLIDFSHGIQPPSSVQPDRIGLLVDQLKASEPANIPSAETEIAALRKLQDLIDRRIHSLTAQSQQSQQRRSSSSSSRSARSVPDPADPPIER
ncbi:PHD finger domain protein [Aspergillus heteromorphus CBS 117.55]|uniref:PHD finger domain protein n=1 Tax=Aspergillus heteromorphus CBS 117.55 TaxID=1448321 RepID=A0A317VZF9_9EURO|nr:PHD finger domain protein [Aspergillus heteromorphus CBS 117.55]PWY79734.1 PHD finger domain protein [Aspergillus heteromorphus CBS 117.55]